jgi:hypothetical protein
VIKLGKVGYHTQLLDLHRSNPFGLIAPLSDEVDIPDAWHVLPSLHVTLNTKSTDLT